MKHTILLVLTLVISTQSFVMAQTVCNATELCDDYPGTNITKCCSMFGYCGMDPAHCGANCVSGACGTTNFTDFPEPNACPTGVCVNKTLCCSYAYYCGSTTQHCGPGCISGPCSPGQPPTINPGQCYPNSTCAIPSQCCSTASYCGYGDLYCGYGCKGGPCLNGTASRIIEYNHSLVYALGVIIGVCVLVAAAAAIILAFKTSYFTKFGPFYCAIIIFGVELGYLATMTALPEQTDTLCVAYVWLMGIGFNLVYGCLFLKTWVVYSIFRGAAMMTKKSIKPFYILKALAIFVGIEVVILTAWTIVDPQRLYYAKFVGADLKESYERQCRSTHSSFWIIFFLYKGLWVGFGCVLSFLTRNVSEEYNSSKSIAYAIYNIVVIVLIGAPLAAVLKNTMYATMIVKVIGIVLSFTFVLFVTNLSVWYKIFYERFDVLTQLKVRNDSTAAATGAPATTTTVQHSATVPAYSSEELHSSDSPSNTNDISQLTKHRYSNSM